MHKIRGQIIRILDNKTVIINLGSRHGIRSRSIFSILAEPEVVVDPFTGEELGWVNVVKGKLGASQVYEKFTIADTTSAKPSGYFFSDILSTERFVRDPEDLIVEPDEVKPWKAQSTIPVQVGDHVEVSVPDPEPELPESSDGFGGSEKDESSSE